MKKLIDKHRQQINYLIAGAWNTLFGYLIFAVLYTLFSSRIHYMILLIISNIFSITNAYISYKFFVFRTKGNYLKEYMRFYVVYGTSIVLSLVLMPAFVELLHINPLIAQAVIIVVTVIFSYTGHKNYSFKGSPR
jgi:putative flippase GtrA